MVEKTDSEKNDASQEDIRKDAVEDTAQEEKKPDSAEKKEDFEEKPEESNQDNSEKKEELDEKSSDQTDAAPKKEEPAKKESKKDSDDDDEEISIDLGKITGFFKGLVKDDDDDEKPKEKPKKEVEQDIRKDSAESEEEKPAAPVKKESETKKQKDSDEDSDDDEIDLGKAKKFFSGLVSSDDDDEKDSQPEKKKESKKSKEDDDDSDDDISLDFGKITSMFKSDKKKSTKSSDDDADDDEIDLSSVKNLFKRDKKPKDADDDDEITIDWTKVWFYAKKYSVVLLLLIPLFIAYDVRMQSINYPVTDNWAQDSVINQVRGQIQNQFAQQFPNLPDQNRAELVNRELDKYLAENQQQIDGQIGATSSFFKDHFKYPDGVTYMPDIDTYYWMRYAENILSHGYAGDEIRDGKSFDNRQLAPQGRQVVGDLWPAYYIAYQHKFLSLFTDMNLVQTMSLYPVIVAMLSTLLVFLIGLRISGKVGATFAAIIFSVHSTLLGRTLYGHADSDAWVIFFPLLVTWLFFVMVDQISWKRAMIYGGLAGATVGLFSFSWIGWWYIFDFILAIAGVLLLYNLATNYSSLKKDPLQAMHDVQLRTLVLGTVTFMVVGFIGVSIVLSPSQFVSGVLGPIGFTSIKSPVDPTLWPNVLTTVAELNPGSFNQAVNSVGGKFLFYFAVAGIVLSFILGFLRRGDQGRKDIAIAILLVLWFASSIYATTKGIRFTLLLAPPFAVAFGTTVGILHRYVSGWVSSELKVHKAITSGLSILLFFMLLIGPVQGAYNSAKGDLPIVNDVWYNSLKAIQANSTETAIITSWWDFGHHFKQIADRPVTFDGTTQRHPNAHWVGKSLLTSDEDVSIGILRMIDCSGLLLHKDINSDLQNPVRTNEIINEIILQEKDQARETLAGYGFSSDRVESFVEKSHCEPPEGFFIASHDMIGKSGVWSHFGSWDFRRADYWFNVRKMELPQAVEYLKERYNFTQKQSEDIYFEVQSITSDEEANRWVAPWPGYGQDINCDRVVEHKDIYQCSNGFVFNYTSKELYGLQGADRVYPRKYAYTTKEGLEFGKVNQSNFDAGIVLVPESETRFKGIVSSHELTGGMFTRMFHMKGHGLKYYDPFYNERGLIGTEVHVYKADWDGTDPYIHEQYVNVLDQIDASLDPEFAKELEERRAAEAAATATEEEATEEEPVVEEPSEEASEVVEQESNETSSETEVVAEELAEEESNETVEAAVEETPSNESNITV